MTEKTQMSDAVAEEYREELKLAKQRAMARQHEAIEDQANLVTTFYKQLIYNGISVDSATHLTGCYILAATGEARPVGILKKYRNQES